MKKKYYFTFGSKYLHKDHPNYPKAHPDGWVVIVASSMNDAYAKASELFGYYFASCYTEENWDPSYFPKGEIESFETT